MKNTCCSNEDGGAETWNFIGRLRGRVRLGNGEVDNEKEETGLIMLIDVV
jgi:hypothetical protein